MGRIVKKKCHMKINNYLTLAALAMFSVACVQKEENAPVDGGQTPDESLKVAYINAVGEGEETQAPEVKSTVSPNANFAWTNGDQIAVYAGGYKISDELQTTENKSNATFTFTEDNFFAQGQRANFAVFPASLVYDVNGNLYSEDVTESSLKINLPTSYDLSDLKDDNAPTPMVAVNAPNQHLQLYSVCALLKFTLHSVPKQTQYITFDFNGKKVQGEFVLENITPGEEDAKVVATPTDAFDDVITVYNDNVFTTFQNNLVVNVPVPAGEYSKVTITSWDGNPWNGGHKINGITSTIRTATADPWVAARKSSGKREVYLPVFTVDGNISLGNGRKAVLAPGNLTAEILTNPVYKSIIGTGTNWAFAENQYDAVVNSGDNSGNIFAGAGKRIDLFCWIGETAIAEYAPGETYGIMYSSCSGYSDAAQKKWDYWTGSDSDGKIMTDWGTLSISGGRDLAGNAATPYPASTWRLPDDNNGSTSEWQRLVAARKDPEKNNASISYHYAKAVINNGEALVARGVILFPDQYDKPSVPVGMPTLNKLNTASASYADNELTLDQWRALESVGCVFLPAASFREKPTADIMTLRMGDGVYWTNYAKNRGTVNGVSNQPVNQTNAVTLLFSDITVPNSQELVDGKGNPYSCSILNKTDLQYAKSFARSSGASVRLLRDIN